MKFLFAFSGIVIYLANPKQQQYLFSVPELKSIRILSENVSEKKNKNSPTPVVK
jgi:hypothetical protein